MPGIILENAEELAVEFRFLGPKLRTLAIASFQYQ
jgi:hypothetical protein